MAEAQPQRVSTRATGVVGVAVMCSRVLGLIREQVFAGLFGAGKNLDASLPLDIRATAFQRQVWTYLQSIPFGQTKSYSEVAQAIGRPSACRAVARACATNPVAVEIPCHRVVREDGTMGGYRWGLARKKALLHLEKGF